MSSTTFGEPKSAISALRACPLLSHLAEDARQTIAEHSRLVSASRGETIWVTGNDVDFFGVVATGFVKMVRSLSTGHELANEIMGPGQVFGLLGTIDGCGCPLSARAVCDLKYVRVPKIAFMPHYPGCSELHDHMMRRTTQRLRQAHDLIAQATSGSVESRLAAILLTLAESYGHAEGEAIVLGVPLTRQDLSEMAGTSVETTIRIMSRWKKLGIVIGTKSVMTITDPRLLEGILRDSA